MKSISNKNLIFIFIAILFIVIAIPTTYKIVKDYHKKSFLVIEKKIVEAAKKCFDEGKCQNDKTTLKELYDNNYLETVVNPVTKKIYDENLIIKKSKNKYEVNVH